MFLASAADLRVSFPEAASAEETGWGGAYRARRGSPTPAWVRGGVALTEGARTSTSLKLTVPAPGLYRVLASAEVDAEASPAPTQRAQSVSHALAWLLVDDDGGRVLSEFDADVVPDGFLPEAGPFRTAAQVNNAARAQAGACAQPTACFAVSYLDHDVGSQPVPNVPFSYSFVDRQTGRVSYSGGGTSDSNGKFVLDCPDEQFEVRGAVTLDGPAMKIIPSTSRSFHVTHDDCGREIPLEIMASKGARVWTIADGTIKNSRRIFGTRSKVVFNYAPSQAGKCGYVYWQNIILLSDATENNEGCIWGPSGVFALAHEYGHAVHHQLGGGLLPLPNRLCDGHYPGDVLEGFACAYNEGFAHYHGILTLSQAYGGLIPVHQDFTRAQFEGNSYFESGMDGSLDEGPVMSFFFDLSDSGSNEPHDRLSHLAEEPAPGHEQLPDPRGAAATGPHAADPAMDQAQGHRSSDLVP